MLRCTMCKCGTVIKTAEDKVFATCLNCSEPLVAENGKKYLINVGPVYVSKRQIDIWRSQGYDINIERLTNNS